MIQVIIASNFSVDGYNGPSGQVAVSAIDELDTRSPTKLGLEAIGRTRVGRAQDRDEIFRSMASFNSFLPVATRVESGHGSIRSWRNALFIIPGALVGICINGFNAFMCLYAYALVGRNMGG